MEESLPTAAELRELISLKDELNRMYREVAATRTAEPLHPINEQPVRPTWSMANSDCARCAGIARSGSLFRWQGLLGMR